MGESWTVMTWNLQGSAGLPVERVAEIVRSYRPDVVAVQEIRRAQSRRLARQLGWTGSWHRKHHPYSPAAWWTTEGMALLTPHRLTDAASTSLTPDIGTWTYRHRILVEGLISRPDGSALRVYDVHLASDDDGASDREEQARRVLRRVVEPAVVAGDLNEAADGPAAVVLADGRRIDAWTAARRRPAGAGHTNPSLSPRQTLDHVLVPADAAVEAAEVPSGGDGWAEISDHLPLVVTIDLPDRQMRSQ